MAWAHTIENSVVPGATYNDCSCPLDSMFGMREGISAVIDDSRVVQFLYTNWKGETALRRVLPVRIYFGCNDWHTDEQWLLDAIDLEKDAERTFALNDIHAWNPPPGRYAVLSEAYPSNSARWRTSTAR